jgi:hypothetical protein
MKIRFIWLILAVIVLLIVPVSLSAQGKLDNSSEIWQIRNYTSARISSFDITGANDDGNSINKIQPGETRTIGNVSGPGIIKHIWITIASHEHYHLKKIVLRIFWDDEATPSVETPIGDFFGLGLGKYFLYNSRFLSVGSQKALNCFFPMPFLKSATITVTNEGEQPINSFYYNIDWEKHHTLPENTAYFHAQYRQETPTDGWTNEWRLNGDDLVDKKENISGEGNYVFMEAEGRGHFIGVTHSILQNQGDWWGEGDEMIFIDGSEFPDINGTGAEDYYLGAWCYGGCGLNPFGSDQPEFDYQDYGNPQNGGDNRGAGWSVFRFHSESPIVFNRSIRVTIEHGHANHRSDNYYTVAYWYQKEPHGTFPLLPRVEERIPALVNTGGPTIGR